MIVKLERVHVSFTKLGESANRRDHAVYHVLQGVRIIRGRLHAAILGNVVSACASAGPERVETIGLCTCI